MLTNNVHEVGLYNAGSNRAWKRNMVATYAKLNTCNRRARRSGAHALLLIADAVEVHEARVWAAVDILSITQTGEMDTVADALDEQAAAAEGFESKLDTEY